MRWPRLEHAVDDAKQHDDAEIAVVPAVDQQRLEGRVAVALGRRQPRDDALQHLGNVEAGLGRDQDGVRGVEPDHVLDLLLHLFGLGRRQVDLVEHGHDLVIVVDRLIDVGERLRLDALGGVDHQERAFAGGKRAVDLVGEIDVAGRVDQVEDVVLAVARAVIEPHGLRLDGDAALALDVHGIEHLLHHLALGEPAGRLDQPVGQRRLAVVDMRDDGEVADIFDGRIHGARISTRVGKRQAGMVLRELVGEFALILRRSRVSRETRSNCAVRRHSLLRQERLERDRLAVARHDRVAGRHRLPMRAVGIERLGHHHHVAAGFPVIERVGVVVGGVAEGVEVAAVGERRCEAQRLLVAVGADHVGERREHARGRADRILVAAGAEDGEEDRFRIGRADARAVERVGDERLDLPPQARPVADHAVMHEQPAAAGEGVAVRARDRRAGRRAHMREIEVRVDVAAEIAQVLVGPGRPDLAIEPGLRMLAVPAHAEAVAVGGGGRFQRPLALHHQRMGGGGHVLFQRDGFAAIGNPAAHRMFLGLLRSKASSIAGGCGKAMAAR